MAAQLAQVNVDLVTRGQLESGLESLEEVGSARVKNFVPLFVHPLCP